MELPEQGGRGGRRPEQQMGGSENHPLTHSKGVYQSRHSGDSTETKSDHKQADGSARKNSSVGEADGGREGAGLQRVVGAVSQEAAFQR